jgi:DNA-binding response OmpR family regulator
MLVFHPLPNPLKNYHILIVDSDAELARTLKAMLSAMGFVNVQTTRSGKEAIGLLGKSLFDFVITEWNTQHVDGIELLNFLRNSPNSPNKTIPVIMLTGRAEQTDVFLARDKGVNEYMVKPFSVRSIYSRLERIIEQPRNFVVSNNFVGPCRRINGKPPEGTPERRVRNVTPKPHVKIIAGSNAVNDNEDPKIWLPDFSLKLKLGTDVRLNDFVTPEILNQTQRVIDAITDDSLRWVQEDLKKIKLLNDLMSQPDAPPTIAPDISSVALLISSRAGTFGYGRATEIAYGLYLFARNVLDYKNKAHQLVVQKHIEVLHVIIGNQMKGNAGAVGAQIASELKKLIAKCL